jgi:hypothetical protein
MSDKDKIELNWAGEPIPSEAEQDRWSKITVVVSLLMGLIVFL